MSGQTLLIACAGGTVTLPGMPLPDRLDGGHLRVHPPREAWKRSALTALELTRWRFLVAAAAQAMLHCLPQLEGGCINDRDAGNGALNNAAAPVGPKEPTQSRKVHMHLLGRSPNATHPDWGWGASSRFPDCVASTQWAAGFSPLNGEECARIAAHAIVILRNQYAMAVD